jgi:hypothetical protein
MGLAAQWQVRRRPKSVRGTKLPFAAVKTTSASGV